MQTINASIITIGDELLIGQTIDTNSAWMAEELNKIGVWVKRRVAVGDVWDDIWNALDDESKNAEIILITGGLGPTADDITKSLLCKYFGGPGMWFESKKAVQTSGDRSGVVFVSLPGVPHEMKGLMKKEVLPRLQQHFELPFILHRTFLTYGMGESYLAEKIKDWERQLPNHIKLAYLPHYGNVRLRLTGIGNDKNELEKELEEQSKVLTAESCTGGYIAHLLTIDPGASSNFKGTVVAYDNKVKENILGVSHNTLETVGAVSEETVKEMAKGVLEKLKTDYALATSGIMGPNGGTDEKPVGTVWIAVGSDKKIQTEQFHFRFDRLRNIEQTAHTALNMLRKFIQNHDSFD